jgi:hypothetical protein
VAVAAEHRPSQTDPSESCSARSHRAHTRNWQQHRKEAAQYSGCCQSPAAHCRKHQIRREGSLSRRRMDPTRNRSGGPRTTNHRDVVRELGREHLVLFCAGMINHSYFIRAIIAAGQCYIRAPRSRRAHHRLAILTCSSARGRHHRQALGALDTLMKLFIGDHPAQAS